jgi:hypothetical protein
MKYLKAFSIIAMIAIIINCKGKKPKKEDNSSLETTFSIEKKRFLRERIDSTVNFLFVPGDSTVDDLNTDEKEKYTLTHDAAHKYKLISIQKKSNNYIGIIVLYIMEGGNKQFFITLDKTGKAISDLLIHSNHRDGPLQLKNGNILMFSNINSHFNGDTITIVEKRFMTESFSTGAKKWEEVNENKYVITGNGTFNHLKH